MTLKAVEAILNNMQEFISTYKYEDRLHDVISFIRSIYQDHNDLKQELSGVLANHEIFKLNHLQDKAFKLKLDLEESDAFSAYCKFKELTSVRMHSIGADKTQKLIEDLADKKIQKAVHKAEQACKLEMTRESQEKLDAQTILHQQQLASQTEQHEAREAVLKEQHEQQLEAQAAQYKTTVEQIEQNHTKVMDSLETKIIGLKEEISTMNKRPIINQTKAQFEAIYLACKGSQINADSNYSLVLKMNDAKDRLLLQMLSRFKLPQLHQIQLDNIEEDDSDVAHFLENSVSDQLNYFWFNCTKSHQLAGSKYIPGILAVAPRTLKYVGVYYTDLSKEGFASLLAASKHCSELIDLRYCKIESDSEFDFGDSLRGWKAPTIYFDYSGGPGYSDWGSHNSRLGNLLKGLGKCPDVRANLKRIDLHGTKSTTAEVRKILEAHGLTAVSSINGLS